MLSSDKRLSRYQFKEFLEQKNQKKIYSKIGTLVYIKSQKSKASVVISSKNCKKSVERNRLKRRIYSIFRDILKISIDQNIYVLYLSKDSKSFTFKELESNIYEIFEKFSK